ncbi:protein DJ-1 homolog B-like [Vigna unguiculata]|uniref:protein DJ-1 homolog B-like n=1 Tax=Vigna unguiculata TaxID=3917 RepID=UPI001016CA37|nr:protein DJ-1 homolog B-like [Vigna unguiculata]
MATSRKVLVPIADGTEPMEAVIIADVLRRAGAIVTIASASASLTVLARFDVKIVADVFVSDIVDTSFDLIAIPGGIPGVENLRDCKVLEGLVKKHVEEGRLYAAVCAAPAVVLGPWGLVNGLKATCFPSLMEKLASYGATTVESRVQVDGKLVTSRAPGTTMEFAVALIEQLLGKVKAEHVAGPLVMRYNHDDEHTFKEFNLVQWTCDNPPKILVPITYGSEEMETVIIIDILRRAKANVVVTAAIREEVTGLHGVNLVADTLIKEAVQLSYDLVVLPGGDNGAASLTNEYYLVKLLEKQRDSNKYYGAICASVTTIFERHGLLKGKKATAYPLKCNMLLDQSAAENRVVVDGNLITSKSPGTGIEFALAIVEKLFGRQLALDIAKALVF